MATKNTTFTLNPNQTPSLVSSTATITGRSVYGTSVVTTEIISQSVPVQPGSVTVTPCATTVSHVSGYTEVVITSSNIYGDLTLSGNTKVVRFTDLSGNTITGVSGNTEVHVRVYYSANTGETQDTIEIEAYGTGLDGNPCSDTGEITQNCDVAVLYYTAGNGLRISTDGKCFISAITIQVADEAEVPNFVDNYVWSEIGQVNTTGKFIDVDDDQPSYEQHTTISSNGRFPVDVRSIELVFTNTSEHIPGPNGSVTFYIPNMDGGRDSFILYQDPSNQHRFYYNLHTEIGYGVPGNPKYWPYPNVEIGVVIAM